MAFVSRPCPLGSIKEKECNGTQKRNKENLIYNACASCEKSKNRIMKNRSLVD